MTIIHDTELIEVLISNMVKTLKRRIPVEALNKLSYNELQVMALATMQALN